MKSRKGATLVLVICIMVVVTMLVAILNIYFMASAAQATKQRERIQTYYLVTAGLEIGVSALMEPSVKASGEQYYPLLEYYAANQAPDTETVPLGKGREVTVTIDTVDADGNSWITGTSTGDVWIRVSAVGTHTNDVGSTVQAGNLRIHSENPASIIRELDLP